MGEDMDHKEITLNLTVSEVLLLQEIMEGISIPMRAWMQDTAECLRKKSLEAYRKPDMRRDTVEMIIQEEKEYWKDFSSDLIREMADARMDELKFRYHVEE